jgi:GR25 family glycosyltransferase involved in LPS biosynthesis
MIPEKWLPAYSVRVAGSSLFCHRVTLLSADILNNMPKPHNSGLLIQVINLATRPDRLALISSDLHKAGLSFETQVAVDGQTVETESKFLSKGEIGCFKSHVNAMRKQTETGAPFSLILEDDAALSPEVNEAFLSEMTELMIRNKLDVLQIGFIEHFYSLSIRRGILEFLIELLKSRGQKDVSGVRFVLGEFRAGAHAYIINNRLAVAISSTVKEPPLIPWDGYMQTLAGQIGRGEIKIARLVKSVVAQASRLSKDSEVDSNIAS